MIIIYYWKITIGMKFVIIQVSSEGSAKEIGTKYVWVGEYDRTDNRLNFSGVCEHYPTGLELDCFRHALVVPVPASVSCTGEFYADI